MPKTVASCLRTAARLELQTQALYLDLAGRFTHDLPLHALFQRLADEEGQHALRIQLLARHQGGTPWPAALRERILGELAAATAGIGQLQAELLALPDPLDPTAVLLRLVEMEDRFGATHAESMAQGLAPAIRELFASLAGQDGKHRELIQLALTSAVA